jgi:imidazolonepropionase
MKRLVVDHIGALYTMKGHRDDPLGIVPNAALVAADDLVIWYGPRESLPPLGGDVEVLDARGGAVLPGLVDCHTHLLFAGDRAREFALRSQGATYAEIMAAGGGIQNTTHAVRAATEDELVEGALPRLAQMLSRGVTTVEAKSGYGLSVRDELKMLRALWVLSTLQPIEVERTFLGAHALPPEYANDRPGYVDLVVEEMLPEVRRQRLASACDIFVEKGAFTVDDGRRILGRAAELGLNVRVHAEQLSHSGGSLLAAEVGAISAGHLEFAQPADRLALAHNGVVAEVLATAQVFLGMGQKIDGRGLVDDGVTVAVATDLNPGSAMINDLHLAAGLAVTQCGLTTTEALLGITRHAAQALARADLGHIALGVPCDLCVLDSADATDLVYDWGTNHVVATVKNGEVVHRRLA